MKIWPWSTIARLERDKEKLQSQLSTEKFKNELSQIANDIIIPTRRRHVEALWSAVVALETIAAQVTPGANGTVRRIARLADEAVAQIRESEPHLYERLKSTGGKAVPYDQDPSEVTSNG